MESNINWSQLVTVVVIRDGKVLLARHTYGGSIKNGPYSFYGIDADSGERGSQ